MTHEELSREFARLETRQLVFVALVCSLILVQIVFKMIIFGWVARLLRKTELMLNMIEQHATITDSRGNRVVEEVRDVRQVTTAAAITTAELSKKVEQVPELVVSKIKNGGGADSGLHKAKPQE